METQIINDSSCIRVVNDGTPLLIIKTQIKTIDTVKNEMVRIDIGEGALRHIYIKHADVTIPQGLQDASALRDAIKAMLDGAGGDFSPLIAAIQTEVGKVGDVKAGIDTLTQQVTTTGQAQVDSTNALKAGIDKIVQQASVSNDAQTKNLADVKQSVDALGQVITNSNPGVELQLIHDEIVTSGKTQATLLTNMTQVLNQINVSLSGNNNNLKYPVRIDESVPMVIYNGFAVSATPAGPATTDPVWAIQKVTRNGDVYIYEWANGNQQFTNVWDNRVNLNYLPLAAVPVAA
jgi:hypothetical protein